MPRSSAEWVAYFRKRLADEEQASIDFERAVKEHKLRLLERTATDPAERDVTERERQRHRAVIEEYRRMLADEP